jgi:hypothetical protein
MKNKLTNPFQDLIAQATKLPVLTGETKKFSNKLKMETTSKNIVIICDLSASMNEIVYYPESKFNLLKKALDTVLSSLNSQPILIWFNSNATKVDNINAFPCPYGSTRLDKAIVLAEQHNPSKTIIISDGQPDDKKLALEKALELSGIIDVIYCGLETDTEAINFMNRLAASNAGHMHVHKWSNDQNVLPTAIRKLISSGK